MKAELNRDDIVVAKLDYPENDVPHDKVKVEGFPTFYLFKAGEYEKPVVYNGGRTVNDWKSWLNTQLPEEGRADL